MDQVMHCHLFGWLIVNRTPGKNISIQENALDINVCQYGRNFVRGDELKNVSWNYDAKRLYKLYIYI